MKDTLESVAGLNSGSCILFPSLSLIGTNAVIKRSKNFRLEVDCSTKSGVKVLKTCPLSGVEVESLARWNVWTSSLYGWSYWAKYCCFKPFKRPNILKNIAIWSRWSGESANTIVEANSYNLYKSKSIFFNIWVDLFTKQTWNRPDWPNVSPDEVILGGALAMLVRKIERRRLWTHAIVPRESYI